MDYKLAYRNEHTEWIWYEISCHPTMQSAERCARDHANTDCRNSELGIFLMPAGASYWKDRKPRLIINRQGRDSSIPASIGGLINNFYKPGNNSL